MYVIFSIYPATDDADGWTIDMLRDCSADVSLTRQTKTDVHSTIAEAVFGESYMTIKAGPQHTILARWDHDAISPRELEAIANHKRERIGR